MSDAAIQQVTFDGEPAEERTKPSTLMYCPETDSHVLRSNRHEWPHELVEIDDDGGDGGLPEDCQFDTETFTVEFTYEVVESVRVEAHDKTEAKRLAEERQTFDGEYMDTLWTETWSTGTPSQASESYLKEVGLLPEDDDDE